MNKTRSLLQWMAVPLLCVLVLIVTIHAQAIRKTPVGGSEGRADVVIIDAMALFGELERPPVVFLHDRHTERLKEANKDCATCHLSHKEHMSSKYLRIEDGTPQEVMDLYHLNCVGCHAEMAREGKETGPVVCGECHVQKPGVVSERQPMGFDKSLHLRHSNAHERRCEVCHHEYNPETKELFYEKGKEGTCRYCHKQETEENRVSMRLASHLACIECHRKNLAEKAAGPVVCKGCHGRVEQQSITKMDTVPRMERSQPDFVFVNSRPKSQGGERASGMDLVAFDHRSHEEYTDTCRVCHHGDLKACAQCHTLEGAKEGRFVKLEQAMHRLDSPSSCLGCHRVKQADPSCVGCHGPIPTSRKKEMSFCLDCHMKVEPPITEAMLQADEKGIAESLLASRQPTTATYEDEAIPEKVVIKRLADKYEAVQLPHRKIVHALLERIKGSKLVHHFHQEAGTLCQGCHHNSPATRKPAPCASCHPALPETQQPFTAGLVGAYHRQCIGCHSAMGLEKPAGCTGCHKEKL